MAGQVLLFIHGTGVRQQGRAQTVARLVKGLAEVGLAAVRVDYVDWGSSLGTKVDQKALDSVLPLARTMALNGVSDAEIEAARWIELFQDPYVELRLASMRRAVAAGSVPLPGTGIKSPADSLDQRLVGLASALPNGLEGGLSTGELVAVAEALRREPIVRDAATGAGRGDDPDLIWAVARSIVALALRARISDPGTGPEALYQAELRDAVVAAVRKALAPEFMGMGGWLADKVKDFAVAKATQYGVERREGLMRGANPGIGDILLYQRRGATILQEIEEKIHDLAKNYDTIVALGHSLGGIMLVDLLSRPRTGEPLPVSALITVGSQAPALYKFDALGDLRLGTATMPFTPWLNVYDRSDFLSFCAERAFPSANGIKDVEIASGVPFPDAHSAYFYSSKLYEEIAAFWT